MNIKSAVNEASLNEDKTFKELRKRLKRRLSTSMPDLSWIS